MWLWCGEIVRKPHSGALVVADFEVAKSLAHERVLFGRWPRRGLLVRETTTGVAWIIKSVGCTRCFFFRTRYFFFSCALFVFTLNFAGAPRPSQNLPPLSHHARCSKKKKGRVHRFYLRTTTCELTFIPKHATMVFADTSCLQWREGTWTVVKARAHTLLRYLFGTAPAPKRFSGSHARFTRRPRY